MIERARARVPCLPPPQLEHCRSLVDQLRLENTQKWRLEERDDWKALVASVQADRRLLQDANASLSAELAALRDASGARGESAGDDGAGQGTAEVPSAAAAASAERVRRGSLQAAECELLKQQLEEARTETERLRGELASARRQQQRAAHSSWLAFAQWLAHGKTNRGATRRAPSSPRYPVLHV